MIDTDHEARTSLYELYQFYEGAPLMQNYVKAALVQLETRMNVPMHDRLVLTRAMVRQLQSDASPAAQYRKIDIN